MQTQRGVTPFIIETINATPSPISHLSVRPSHPPPRRSRVWGMHRRMCMPAGMCALTDAYLQNIFVLFSTSFILLDSWQRCTSADKSDTGQKNAGWETSGAPESLLRNGCWPFLQGEEGDSCSSVMARIQQRLPSAAINNGRQSASQRRGKCSHL